MDNRIHDGLYYGLTYRRPGNGRLKVLI